MAVADNGSRRDLKNFVSPTSMQSVVQVQIAKFKADDLGQAQSRAVSEDQHGIQGERAQRRSRGRITACRIQEPADFLRSVDMWPAAASEHLLRQDPVAFRRRHCQPTAIQFLGNDSAELDALHFARRGRSAGGVFPNQRGQRLLIGARPLLQEPVEMEKAVFVAVTKPAYPHAIHMLPHDRPQVTAVPWRWTKCFQRLGWLRDRQRAQHGRRGAALILAPEFRDRVGRDSFPCG